MRLDPLAGPGYHALLALSKAVDADARFPVGLLELLRLRCSRINGCTYCIRLHSGQALEAGEGPERVEAVDAWRTHPAFSEVERSAFALAEAVTLVHDGHVPDDVLHKAIRDFGPAGAQQLIWVALVINSFNRLAIGMRLA
ncbi:carboxymuconolactone decarboxylase family protein [Saccharothrix australiensis]|uniref:AhpD family alkylhydroperoxidase n=1 Tax=Saccharothrix australiensis TaxID=2072 RepID=A0A495VZV2_9PSEU|nr:carboxymuconolactone decarboxylase family protein [Saccharothrix australiensis]RKT54896.1 AhpD family alkylhydroperoxidase [Saccharothrix australiensis]